MSRRRIGQEHGGVKAARVRSCGLDELSKVLEWGPIEGAVDIISCSPKGEPAWPPLALFKALLLSIGYDLSDVKLAEALDDRASFRQFCGFSRSEQTPERTAFVRFRKALIQHGLDKTLFELINLQLKTQAIKVKNGTLIDATIIGSASKSEETLRRLKAWNRSIHRVRGRIEKIFGTWKRSHGLRRMRYRGLAKATLQVYLTAMAINLKRVSNLLTAG